MLNYRFLIFSAAATIFSLDQMVKLYFVRTFAPGESHAMVQNIFHLTYVQNTGAAFGILKGAPLLLIGISGTVLIAILAYILMTKPASIWLQLALGSILGGSTSNLLDRVTRGYVVDYLDFRVWPVFNIADMMINIGVAMLLLHVMTRKKESA